MVQLPTFTLRGGGVLCLLVCVGIASGITAPRQQRGGPNHGYPRTGLQAAPSLRVQRLVSPGHPHPAPGLVMRRVGPPSARVLRVMPAKRAFKRTPNPINPMPHYHHRPSFPRKSRHPKHSPKYQSSKTHHFKARPGPTKGFSPQINSYGSPIQDSYTKYSKTPVMSTTYGIPHPTHGSPQPPSFKQHASSSSVSLTKDTLSSLSSHSSHSSHLTKTPKDPHVATSFVQFYKGTDTKDLYPESTQHFGPNSFSYSQTTHHGSPPKHKGSVFDTDLAGSDKKIRWNHQSEDSDTKRVFKTDSTNSTGSFKAPKHTYGFQPYDETVQDSFSVSHGYLADSSSLSPNYYESQSKTKSSS